ncbi:S41 family peptidase [Candidatus Gottesmanbacteria bacterium]|nr:S41 family peptidase [Candidatus Gottesmanbacteria bacterium]
MKLSVLRNLIIIFTFVVVAFGAGYNAGQKGVNVPYVSRPNLVNTTPTVTQNVDFALFWEVWKRLYRDFTDKKSLDPQKMVYGAISGMVQSLGDPYTVFLPPTQNKETKDSLGGHFEGIGAQLGVEDKKIIVVAPLKGTPAEKAGIKTGDWIIEVDGKETTNWTLPETVSAIRGRKGTKVVLSIVHKNATKPSEIAVLRDTINVPSVEWSMKTKDSDKVVYLKLSQFGDPTNAEWNKAVDEIEAQIQQDSDKKIKGLILDVRNNPGGYLSGAVYIASEFLPNGVIVMQESADGSRSKFEVNRTGRLLSIPMVVLVNKGSASASEIVGGALQDRKRATLVGETTFGKGSIQDVQELSGGAGLHITVAKWLLPSGKWVNGDGVTPGVKVENDEEKPDEDLQLNKAIEILVK